MKDNSDMNKIIALLQGFEREKEARKVKVENRSGKCDLCHENRITESVGTDEHEYRYQGQTMQLCNRCLSNNAAAIVVTEGIKMLCNWKGLSVYRYCVTHFPSYHGTPYETNYWFLAKKEAMHRRLSMVAEVRLNDRKTGQVTVW